MPITDYEKGIAALRELLPIEDCPNCGSDAVPEKTGRKNQTIPQLPDLSLTDHPNLIR